MKCTHTAWTGLVLGIGLFTCGCQRADAPVVRSEMQHDFDHDHRHQHGSSHDHEHAHEDGYAGAHSHPHSHSHRHGEPLHGGRIVSIGHSHHGDAAAHYHAEIMPLEDGRITFHVLTESPQGAVQDVPLDAAEIAALINEPREESTRAREAKFVAIGGKGDRASTFVATIPEQFVSSRQLSVVVPEIMLGGEQLKFTFVASRKPVPETKTPPPRAASQRE